jgi:hypothetical protein
MHSYSYTYFRSDAKTLRERVAEIKAWAKGRDVFVNPKSELFGALKDIGVICIEGTFLQVHDVAIILTHID